MQGSSRDWIARLTAFDQQFLRDLAETARRGNRLPVRLAPAFPPASNESRSAGPSAFPTFIRRRFG